MESPNTLSSNGQEAEVASASSSSSSASFSTTTPTFRPNATKVNDETTSSSSGTTTTMPTTTTTEEGISEKSSTNQQSAESEAEKVKAEKAKKAKESDSETDEAKTFECNICLDTAKDAVVSPCGHLFCWPCLHQWLETRPNRQSCPVCKAAISREKVIPLYGRGGSGQDPRSKIPPRPTPTRQESPENRFTWGGGGLNGDGAGSFHLSFGIGAFPFGFFASAFNWGQPGVAGANLNPQLEDQEFLSKIFLWVALIFIVWLLLA